MKTFLIIPIILCVLLLATGCQWKNGPSVGIYEGLDNLAGNLGSSQITKDDDLIGNRCCATDSYSGSYHAECSGQTGRDVIFGGASIEDRVLLCSGKVSTESGDACVRIRLNQEVYLLPLDPEGCFETELYLRSGGNYVMIDFTDFVGTVEMTCEYLNEQGSASEE